MRRPFDTDEDNNEGVEEPDEEEVADSETETDNELLETQKGNEEKLSSGVSFLLESLRAEE